MLIKKVKNDYSFGNEKRLAIYMCGDDEQGEEVKPKDIEKLYKLDDYKGIIFRGESFNNSEMGIREMSFLCSLIEEHGGDSWAETKLDILHTINYPNSSWTWFFLTRLNYIFNLDNDEIYMKEELSIGEYLWKHIEYKE